MVVVVVAVAVAAMAAVVAAAACAGVAYQYRLARCIQSSSPRRRIRLHKKKGRTTGRWRSTVDEDRSPAIWARCSAG